ncbi:hypothetical protein [Cellulomonas sp. P24]|uniref:restriction system modified-DNA reader domain-containing protein n=1 Tax=Cellulomonas sp. P24 TaxID=2885206 RepID=UPI00216B43BB|nr:hypothetical protein [Cellulomonas sp. P24]MCR6493349.1 hypothetical protein [Cellulomonas sp. P24]
MPIFELDAGRPVLVQPMQPAAGAFEAETQALVSDHLSALLNEHVFPVVRSHGAPGEPQVLALDAHGQPVVAEVVRVLDGESLVRALQHAGATSRLSTDDLARAYTGGAHAFADDLVAFRESLPIAVRNAPSRSSGARVVVFCAEVAESVHDAVEFLRQSGRQVEVLVVGVVRGHDGRRLLEVSPLGAPALVRRPTEPASRWVGPGDAFTDAIAYDPARAGARERRLPRPRPDIVSTGPYLGDYQGAGVPTGQHLIVTGQHPLVPDAASTGGPPVAEPPGAPFVLPQPMPGGAPVRVPAAERVPTAERVPVAERVPTAERMASTGAHRERAGDDRGAARERPPRADVPGSPLSAIARELGGATLVWVRERRGERFEAHLRSDGTLQLADGKIYLDPDAAARAAIGVERDVDGWRTWRVGEHGPTLAEAAAAAG